jgi:hypothetical protein
VSVDVDEGNNEGVYDNVLDMEKNVTEGLCHHHHHLKCSRGAYPLDGFVIVIFDQRE